MPVSLRPATGEPVALATLAELLKIPAAEPGPLVSGVTHAGDEVLPGDLYAALPGSRRHGAEFIGQAAEAGAVAVLTDPAGAEMAAAAGLPALVVDDPRAVLGIVADRVYGEPSRDLVLIGITGTAGKTSTAYLVESGLRAAGHVTGVIGTVETRLGDLTIKSKRTTPEATDLHALLAVARENGVTAVVMEVSSHALALGRVGGVRFAVAGWTNFGLDHLDFHATTEEYFAAKASLFDGRARSEVLNLDDPALTPLIKPTTITYSASGNTSAIWYAQGISGGYDQQFTAYGPGGAPVRAGVALAGRHNVANALLALASLTEVGVDPQTAADGIAACPGVPGRLERVAGPVNTRRDIVGVVDYAHKPDAIVAALKALRELAEYRHGRLICVIGAGGDRDRGKRPIMGKAAADGSDLLIVTDDNPRTEDPAQVRAEVIAGVPNPADVIEIAGRRTAIDEAVRLARTGDVIAVLGKGHETGQEVGDEVLPFDDRVELADALTAAALAEGESA